MHIFKYSTFINIISLEREIEGWTDMNSVVYVDSDRGQISREIIRNHEFYYAKSNTKI